MPQDTKIFRDPVYGLVSFDKEKSRPLLDLIDCLEVQRLKRIRQLGLSYFTFPSATHDRFSHSLGMAYLVGLILDQLDFGDSVQIPDEEGEYQDLTRDEFKLLLQMAALLHDVGHGPFSHAFEQATGIKHEKLTQDIIQDNETQVNQTLCTIERKVLKKNAVGWLTGIINGTFPLFWARDLISSQVDADRMDYLLRDAYMCGVNYVSFDRQWIINNPYKEEYLLGKSKAEDAGHIWLLRSDGDIAELSTESTIIGSLRNQINRRTRAYIHRYFVKKLKEKGI
jgi:HD superfamily phosphohydrolase